MIDKSPPPRQSGRKRRQTAHKHLATFTPVPRQTTRHDGWTPERQRGFIEALADTGSVKHAAHAVNMTPEGAYVLRRHPEAGSFRKAWEAALSLGVQRLEDVAMERALHGIEVPVYSPGKIIGTRRVYNDRLLMFVLRNRAGKRFAQGNPQGVGAASRSQLERLKREWRAEWEAEAKKADDTQGDLGAVLEKRFATLHTTWVQGMSAETLRYYKAFRLAKCAQDRRMTLAELEIDPFDPEFDIDATLKQIDCNPPRHIREQGQEMGGDADTAESYLTPRLSWRDMPDEDEDEDEDED
ncbi:hypothetical protein [Novosphingobium sp. 9U]|uniref:hypothetical protein n=1 Tax=Novosphingobium sp. 9U TaxID=2653158 RepID=UPI0012F06EFA|nr:hypothetical protein [Novosphingobium sp. 9U]VWX54460.1 hypothetical protein NOVOSPHI9U_630009 [Novosphingobium sp. 9U]